MDASDTPRPSAPDDTPPEAHIHITAPGPGDRERVVGRFLYELPDGWTVSGAVSRTWTGLAVTELTIEPRIEFDDEPGQINSKLLRRIPTGAILAAAQAAGLTAPEAKAPAPPAKRPSGRQPLSDELLRDVAEKYLRETAPGKPRGAITRLAEHFGKPKPMISRWVMRAREDGWLGSAVPGREGGEPGPRLLLARKEGDGFIPTKEATRLAELEGPPSPDAADEPQQSELDQGEEPISRRPAARPLQSSIIGFAAAHEALTRSLWPKRPQGRTGNPGEGKPGDRPTD